MLIPYLQIAIAIIVVYNYIIYTIYINVGLSIQPN